jgi:RNA 3'-terminal phosphate cyclase (ATP)
MIEIDGSRGEGGGQILRTALGLSMLTGKAFHLAHIRAGRKIPGLRNQHLACVRAAKTVSHADSTGDFIGSDDLVFCPGDIACGDFAFDVGSAGSSTLVLQTILPALIQSSGRSDVEIKGGTHNTFAPPEHFFSRVFCPLLGRIGFAVDCTLGRYGFYPAGGGIIRAGIMRESQTKPLVLCDRGRLLSAHVRAIVSNLNEEIAKSESDAVARGLGLKNLQIHTESVESNGPGNVVMIELCHENVTEVFTGFGERGKHRDRVSGEAILEAREYISSGAPVGKHLADQLLIPLAIAKGGSFITLTPTLHTRTNAEIIKRFLDVEIVFEQKSADLCEITVHS